MNPYFPPQMLLQNQMYNKNLQTLQYQNYSNYAAAAFQFQYRSYLNLMAKSPFGLEQANQLPVFGQETTSSSPVSSSLKTEDRGSETFSEPKFTRSEIKSEESNFKPQSILIQKKAINPVKQEACCKVETTTTVPSSSDGESSHQKSLGSLDFEAQNKASSYSRVYLDFEESLRNELERMVKFILSNMGKVPDTTFEDHRNVYQSNPRLLKAYDTLLKKYFSSKKVKEELIRYIMRKALKTMKKGLADDSAQLRGKKASQALCQRYFLDQIASPEMLQKDSEDIVDHFFPYQNNSKNKTINMKFVNEIFASTKFRKDYLESFLPGLPSFLIEDNNKKVIKLVDLLMICVKENNFSKIMPLKVFPWLDSWLDETKNLAASIIPEPEPNAEKKTKL